jgi:hypothetical protein
MSNSIQDLLEEDQPLPRFGLRGCFAGQFDLHAQNILRIESEIDVQKPYIRVDQQTSTGKQYKRHSDIGDHEKSTDTVEARSPVWCPSSREGLAQIDPGGG